MGFSPFKNHGILFSHFFCVEIQEDPMVFMTTMGSWGRNRTLHFLDFFGSAKGMICDHDCSQDPKSQEISLTINGKVKEREFDIIWPLCRLSELNCPGWNGLLQVTQKKLPIGRKMIFVSFWPMGFCWIWGSKFRDRISQDPPLFLGECLTAYVSFRFRVFSRALESWLVMEIMPI